MPKLLNKTNLPNYASAPSSPANGDIYYNTTDHKVYARQNDAWVDLSSGGGSGNIIYYQSAEPTTGTYAAGDLWIDSDDYIVGSGSIVDSVTSTSTTAAASANAVKLAYDTASSSGNALLNGAMEIWQRGTSGSGTSFGADRWYGVQASGQTLQWSQQSFTAGTAPVSGYEGTYFLRNTWSGTPSGFFWVTQKVEDVRAFAGQTVTLSFWAKASSSTSALSMAIEQNFGTGGSTGTTTVGSAMSLTTSWQRFSQTLNVPSVSGKTIGTDSYLDVRPFYGNSSVSGLNIDLWGVQLESGSVATTFSRASRSITEELAACQRYYIRFKSDSAVYAIYGTGVNKTTTTATIMVPFPVKMRKDPSQGSLTDFSTLQVLEPSGAVAPSVSSISLGDGTNAHAAMLDVTVGSATLTAHRPCMIRNGNSTSAYIGFSAEF